MDALIKKAISVTPHERQIKWQQLEFTAFLHFGMNTFTDREWGDGKESPSLFNPSSLDTDQWCQAIKKAGITACIATAKHHDGFCLWNTKYTEHCIRNAPVKEDIIARLSSSCKKHGLKFGIYLSPWDRHEKTYGFGDSYNDYFCNQLEELLTSYGDIYTVWFDGACGEGTNGKKQIYDWERYYKLIRRLQPNAVISVCGPDVRWCGNEAGVCRSSEWSVVPSYMCDNEKVHDNSQQSDDTEFRERTLSSSDDDLGSREIIAKAKELIWYPAEVDTSIRPGWFYHESEDDNLRSLEKLVDIYINSVGGNSVLLLNIPPNREGRLARVDCDRLFELGSFIEKNLTKSLSSNADITASSQAEGFDIKNALTDSEAYYKAKDGDEQCEIIVKLKETTTFSYLTIKEQIKESQRIEAFSVTALIAGKWENIYNGTTVGYKRICKFKQPISSDTLKLSITSSRFCPTIKYIALT